MYFSTIVAALLPVGAALAAEITVMVGMNGTLTYTPDSVNATVGDVLTFEFVAGNHTITQSTFATPCSEFKFANGSIGVDSGFMPGSETDTPSYSFAINDTSAPLWFYCRHPGHCEAGMVFAVNAAPSGSKDFAAFQAAAKATKTNTTSMSMSMMPSGTSMMSMMPSSTMSTHSGAGAVRLGGAAAALSAVGLVAGLVL